VVTTKNRNVYFEKFTPALQRILTILWRLDYLYSYNLVITSANDSSHMTGSQHYKNTALDVRVHNIKDPHLLKHQLEYHLGKKFTVLYEGEGTSNAHIHIQVKKGLDYTFDDLYKETSAEGE
jgi:hypothetical protein